MPHKNDFWIRSFLAVVGLFLMVTTILATIDEVFYQSQLVFSGWGGPDSKDMSLPTAVGLFLTGISFLCIATVDRLWHRR